MMKRPSGLGRGLGALIPPSHGGTFVPARDDSRHPSDPASLPVQRDEEQIEAEALLNGKQSYRELPVASIVANPHQPRQHFDHAALEDLVSSIQERGIVEPLIVTSKGNGAYELIAGERRLRAANIAGFERVPCIIRTATEQEKLELALIENVQRHDLNPIEEAYAYRRLMDEFGMTQDEVGERVGKSRPQVGNTVRLLQLPQEIQQALMDRKISASHARTLLSLPTDAERMDLFHAMLEQNFTVREVERRVPAPRRSLAERDPNLVDLEQGLRESLGHRVVIKRGSNGDGEIRIPFQTDEDLSSLCEKLKRG